jgi:hypothetical protein
VRVKFDKARGHLFPEKEISGKSWQEQSSVEDTCLAFFFQTPLRSDSKLYASSIFQREALDAFLRLSTPSIRMGMGTKILATFSGR